MAMASNNVIDLCDDSEDERSTPISFSLPTGPNEKCHFKTEDHSISNPNSPIELEDSEVTDGCAQIAGKRSSGGANLVKNTIAASNVSKRRKTNADAHKNDVVILLDEDDEEKEDSDDDELLGFSSGLRRKHLKKPAAAVVNNMTSDPRKVTTKGASARKQTDADTSMERRRNSLTDARATNHQIIELDNSTANPTAAGAYANEAQQESSGFSRKSPPESSRKTTESLNPYIAAAHRVSSSPPIVNPYRQSGQRQVPPARAKQTMPSETSLQVYPKLLENSKLYPDERARFLRAFWNYGRKNCTKRSFERPKLDIIAKRIVKLALSEYPVRSLEEFVAASSSHKAVSALKTACKQLQQELTEGGYESIVTPFRPNFTGRRKFHSVVEASLAGFLHFVKEKLSGGEDLAFELKNKAMWISLEDFIPIVDRLLMTDVPKLGRNNEADNGAEYLTQSSTRSLEFLQVAKLETPICGGPFLKRHTLLKKVHYELLPAGYEAAKRIDSRSFPEAPGHYRCSKAVKKEYEGICIAVDLKEGGGGKRVLHTFCNKLDMQKIPYFVGCLSIGDYAFFSKAKDGSMDLLCPILVERKSVQDIAGSIKDGRWSSQKRRMYAAQHLFGYGKCQMVYIIEGNINKETVTGEYIGARWLEVTVEKLNEEIENLQSEGFEVLRTTSAENSMFELARWARRVAKEIQMGTMELKFTYQTFKEEIATIPKQMDFSRIAKDHAKQRLQEKNHCSQGGDFVRRRTNKAEAVKPKSVNMQNPEDEYVMWKKLELEAECSSLGLPKSGSRTELINRLRGPRPPKLWLERKRLKQYVPSSYNVAGTALLVALYLHEEEQGLDGMTKDELYVKAEGLNITKNPFSGGTTQTGPYHYDGWSSMKFLLSGDPALMTRKKGRYLLTRSCSIAGYPLARALHLWCHEHGNCSCSNA